MKRDMELIRDMLLWMEGQDDRLFIFNQFPVFNQDSEATIGHIALLKSAGFLDEPRKGFLRVTWEGHEFIEKVRDPEIWSKTKDGASKIGSWGIKILGELASGYLKQKAGELGIPLI